MIENVLTLISWVVLFSTILCMFLWLVVILVVNPVLDPLFNNDVHFNWFIRRAHSFFFSYRAQCYAGAVISKRLAKRSMGIKEDDPFRERLDWMGRLSCWSMMISEMLLLFCGIGVVVLKVIQS